MEKKNKNRNSTKEEKRREEKRSEAKRSEEKTKQNKTKPKNTGIVCEGSLTMPSHLLNTYHSASDRPYSYT